MTEVLGQPVVVEQRPGAGGVIASQTVSTAPPDGYTLLQATASYTINTALQTSQFDLGRDFAPVGRVSTSPFVLVVHPSVPAKTLAELIAYAKANPGKLNYASSGIGTPPHLAGELFKAMAGVDILHVPFREANSGLNAVLGGSVQMMFSISSTVQSQLGGGMVRGHRRHHARAHTAGARPAGDRTVRTAGVRSDRLERLRRPEGNAAADPGQAQRGGPRGS